MGCMYVRRVLALLLAGFIFGCAASATAENGALSGLVTDRSDMEPLVGAVVTLKSSNGDATNLGAVTDTGGRFEIKNVPSGTYSVRVTFVGYAPRTYRNITISPGETITRDVALTPSPINLNAISVSASRRREKIVDAPAAVSVVDDEAVAARTTLTVTEHVKIQPGVDIATTGLVQSNMVVRGFNNIFSGALLVLTDNRIARVPSLRFNAYNFIPTTNADIERIEIVSGPGSALYGPNSATGVMHVISKSPFGSEGTTVSLGGGERDVMIASFRHAGSYQSKFGYKITAEYYQGNDWESSDPAEPDSVRLFKPSPTGPIPVGGVISNERNFDVDKFSGEARMDYFFNDDASIVLSGGLNQANQVELTGLGAAQAIDWRYWYTQAKFNYKNLFVQGFVNASQSGDTYLLQTGQLIIDRSRLWAGQVQHYVEPTDQLMLTYGFDALFTRPNTESTINGRNEEKDNINEYGVYAQADYKLSDQWRLLGATRMDDHNRLEDLIFSPRAGVVFQPTPDHNLRATYNRAFSTPDNNNFYLDIVQAVDPFGVGSAFEPSIGFSPDIDIRVQGVPENGFHWRYDSNGPMFRSSFAPVAGLTTEDFISMNDPLFTNVMWGLGRGATISGIEGQLQEAGLDQPTIDAAIAAVDGVTPNAVSGVNNIMRSFDIDGRTFVISTMDDIADINPMKPTITETFELGYKGTFADRFRFSVDLYRTKKFDFIGPLQVESPNVFLDPATLQTYLGPQFAANYAAASDQDKALLDQLDNPAFGGNGNGSPVDELTAIFTSGAAGIPFGTVTPEEMLNPDAVLVTYRNFGDIAFYGLDFGFAYHLTHHWNIGGSYSYVSKNFWDKTEENQVHDIYLNAPKHKFGGHIQYSNPSLGLDTRARVRWVDAFDMISPFYGTTVQSFVVVDLNASYRILPSTALSLTVQNVFDNKHIEFVGAPEIGRLALLRVTYQL